MSGFILGLLAIVFTILVCICAAKLGYIIITA